MKRNKFKKFVVLALLTIVGISLTACNKKQSQKSNLPSAKTVLTNAENTEFKNMHATWLQTDAHNKTLQKAEAKYNKKPTIIYADFTTNSNHYKMWIQGKNSYVQMQGAATNRWFKTKMSKASSYAQLTSDLAQSALLSFSDNTAKLFKVKENKNGYVLSYSGNSKKIWKAITDNSMITSVIGIDLNDAQPDHTNIQINTDKKYNLTKVDIDSSYKDDSSKKHLKLKIDDINQLPTLKVPDNIIKSAVNLGSLSKIGK